MNASYSKKWSLLVFALSVFILYFYLKEAIFTLNDWIYHANGDALKNYFNVVSAANYSNGLWLNNVNYPFGEQLFYLDSQPILAKIIKLLGLQNYTIGIINFLPLIAIAITSIPVFLIQRDLKIPLFINIFTSIIIAFLSPQIVRIQVHFALAYSFFIPSIMYLLTTKHLSYFSKYFTISIFITVFAFLHPYYLLIGVVLLAAFMPYHVFIRFNIKGILLNILSILIPLLLIKLSLVLTDTITDRPDFPFGIWKYRSTFESVFFPKFKPFTELISIPFGLKNGTFEGNAYVGILGFPFLLFSGIRFIKQKIKGQNISSFFRTSEFSFLSLSALIIWTFALYYPLKFIIDPMLELFPALKQFRSLGRFGWIFYYTFSIFISINLSNIFLFVSKKVNPFLASITVFFLCALWYIDANQNLNLVKDAISNRKEVNISQSEFLTSKELNQLFSENDFDAILSLPLFNVGSEIENYEGSGICVFETYKISNIKQLPYISTFSSRVSSSQFYSIKALKFNGETKNILKNQEIILIIADKNDLNKTEKKILDQAEILYEKGNLIYGKIQF